MDTIDSLDLYCIDKQWNPLLSSNLIASVNTSYLFWNSTCDINVSFETTWMTWRKLTDSMFSMIPTFSYAKMRDLILSTLVKVIFYLLKLAIVITFRLMKILLANILFQTQKLVNELFVTQNQNAICFTLSTLVIIFLVRRRMNYWKQRKVPYECLMAHLRDLKPNCWRHTTDDVSRVQRLGKIFG